MSYRKSEKILRDAIIAIAEENYTARAENLIDAARLAYRRYLEAKLEEEGFEPVGPGQAAYNSLPHRTTPEA